MSPVDANRGASDGAKAMGQSGDPMRCSRATAFQLGLIVIVPLATAGCRGRWSRTFPAPWARTFLVQDASSGEPTRGHPFIYYEPQVAIATWQPAQEGLQPYTTHHITVLPRLMAVDAERALLGTTTATFTNHSDGTLQTGTITVDQKIPEVISAMGDLVTDIGGITKDGTRATEPSSLPQFTPTLEGRSKDDTLISIRFIPWSCGGLVPPDCDCP
jgi:hypothetical protein